jgi:hypothetical protein
MTKRDFEMIAAAVRASRPVSMDMTNDGVRAAHTQLDMFVHNFADLELNKLDTNFDRAMFCLATNTPLNRFDR